MELVFSAACGGRFAELAGVRGHADFAGRGDIADWIRENDSGATYFISYLRAATGRAVFIARARDWWWLFQPLRVFTNAEALTGSPQDWSYFEFPEPWWGMWNVLPFWAAQPLDLACEQTWEITSTEDGAWRLNGVTVVPMDFANAPRHERAHSEGAAVLADWDAIDQYYPSNKAQQDPTAEQ